MVKPSVVGRSPMAARPAPLGATTGRRRRRTRAQTVQGPAQGRPRPAAGQRWRVTSELRQRSARRASAGRRLRGGGGVAGGLIERATSAGPGSPSAAPGRMTALVTGGGHSGPRSSSCLVDTFTACPEPDIRCPSVGVCEVFQWSLGSPVAASYGPVRSLGWRRRSEAAVPSMAVARRWHRPTAGPFTGPTVPSAMLSDLWPLLSSTRVPILPRSRRREGTLQAVQLPFEERTCIESYGLVVCCV